MPTPARRSVTAVLAGAIIAAVTLTIGAAESASAARPGSGSGSSGPTVQWTLTRGDGRALLAPQSPLTFGSDRDVSGAVVVDPTVAAQTVVGVGAAVTESAAHLLARLPAAERATALRSVFDPVSGAGVSVVRVPLGASDFALGDYTYDDVPAGQTDESLAAFSLEREEAVVIPLLREALEINPSLQAVLAAWSPPAWMKSGGSTHGGSLLPQHEDVYARYLARAARGFVDRGVPVRAMSVVNEPGHATASYPTTYMPLDQQQRVAVALRRELDGLGLATVGILALDHNWEDAGSAVTALTGEAASAYSGAAFHCYAGDVSAQSQVVAAAPGKEVWTTECTGGSWSTSFSNDLRWGARNMLVGAFRNGSVASLWWNLALDPSGGPTNGGCATCRGVLTVDPDRAATSRNVEYYSLAHVGRFVPRGSVRILTPARTASHVESVAFRTPDGRLVLVLLNDNQAKQTVTVRWSGKSVSVPMPGHAVATATWTP